MAAIKQVDIAGIGLVTLTKRPQSRSIRLSIRSGSVHVSLPRWTPFAAGINFATNHADWIEAELAKQLLPTITSGQRVGKLHYVRFEQVLNGQPITSRVTATEIIVRLLPSEQSADAVVQKRAATACIRALKREAARLLLPRLASLAEKHGLATR